MMLCSLWLNPNYGLLLQPVLHLPGSQSCSKSHHNSHQSTLYSILHNNAQMYSGYNNTYQSSSTHPKLSCLLPYSPTKQLAYNVLASYNLHTSTLLTMTPLTSTCRLFLNSMCSMDSICHCSHKLIQRCPPMSACWGYSLSF